MCWVAFYYRFSWSLIQSIKKWYESKSEKVYLNSDYKILFVPRISASTLEILIVKSSREIYFQDRYCKSKVPHRILKTSNYLIINNALRAPFHNDQDSLLRIIKSTHA